MRHVALLSLLCLSLSAPAYSATQQELKNKLAAARLKAENAAPQSPVASGPSAIERVTNKASGFFDREKTIMTMDAPTSAPSEMMQDHAETVAPSLAAPVADVKKSAPVAAVVDAPKGKQVLAQIKDSDTPDVVPITTVPKDDAVTKKIAKAEADLKTDLQASRAKAESVKTASAAKIAETQAVAKTAETKKTVAKSTVIAESERFELPQAMPAAKPRVLDTTKAAPVPSIAQAVPAVPVMPRAAIAKSRILASPARGQWSVRLVGAEDLADAKKQQAQAFCLMENRFDNSATLMIAQRADGYSTLGVNYGIDMLERGRSYSTLVQIDQAFEENFNGYAETDRMLVVQLGKKQSLFASLMNAEGLYVHVPGSASGFSVQGVGTALDKFTQCLSSIGGSLSFAPVAPLNPQQTMPAVPAAAVESDTLTPPVIASSAPVVTAPPVVALPDPVVATPKAAIVPPVTAPIKAPAVSVPPLAAPVADTSAIVAPAVAAAPVTAPVISPAITAPVPAVKPENIVETKVAAMPTDGWSGYIMKILNASGLVTLKMQQSAATKEWTDPQGMHGQAWRVPGTDLLNAALSQIDVAEQECKGQFSNQIGAPEMVSGNAVQLMESKCVSAHGTSVSTWLLHQNHSGITAWEFRAPQNLGSRPFDARSQIMKTLESQS